VSLQSHSAVKAEKTKEANSKQPRGVMPSAKKEWLPIFINNNLKIKQQ